MTDAITLSGPAVAVVGALLTSLCTTVGVLFWQLLASKNSAIEREQELTDKLLPAVEENTRTIKQLVELVRELTAEIRRTANGRCE